MPKKDAMGMEYVPVYANAAQNPGEVRISARRVRDLGVETALVERRSMERTVRALGTIRIDEARQTIIAPRFEGWIEKHDADATGMKVADGAPLFVFYSPQVANIAAQGDGYTEILAGLEQGGRVVTSANFLIDSESRLRTTLEEFAPADRKR